MDFTTNKLILAGYLMLGLLCAVIGFTFVRSQRNLIVPPVVVQELPRSSRTIKSGSASTALAKQLRIDIQQQRERITELQILLAKRERVLNQQAAQLETQTASSRQLQAEADRYLRLLTTVVQESAQSMDENLDLLESVDAPTVGSLDGAPPPTYEALEAALQAAQWELDQSLEATSESEVALAEQVQRTLLLRQAIVNAGEMAIPLLVNMLSEGDNELRVWAASALARVAGDSPIAINALLEAVDDEDADVRAAAQTAVQDLTGSN